MFSHLGIEGEGWIDPWSLLRAFKQKNISLGTKYIHGELIDFEFLTKQDHGSGDRELRLDSGVVGAELLGEILNGWEDGAGKRYSHD